MRLKKQFSFLLIMSLFSMGYAFSTASNVTVHAGSDNVYTMPNTQGALGQAMQGSADDLSQLEWGKAPHRKMMMFEVATPVGIRTVDDGLEFDLVIGSRGENITAWTCNWDVTSCRNNQGDLSPNNITEYALVRVCLTSAYGDSSNSAYAYMAVGSGQSYMIHNKNNRKGGTEIEHFGCTLAEIQPDNDLYMNFTGDSTKEIPKEYGNIQLTLEELVSDY